MIAYLLDTNIVSALIRDPLSPAADQARHFAGRIGVSIVAAAELRYGAAKRGSARLTKLVETALAALPVLALDTPFDSIHADLRVRLERSGTPLSANDLLIAAHALTLDCVLVTDDRAFANVPGLSVENWLRA